MIHVISLKLTLPSVRDVYTLYTQHMESVCANPGKETHTPLPVSTSKRGPKFFNLQPRTQNFRSESTYRGPTVTCHYPMGDTPYTF